MFNTRFAAFSSLILLSLYSASVHAVNDWAKPCFNGTCAYDLPDDPSGPSGTLKIWGSNTAIADITTAGGWEIIGCDPNKQKQDIRIVCKGIDVDGDGDNDGCSHLFAKGLGSSSGGNGTDATASLTSLPVPTGTVVDVGGNSTSTDEDQHAIGKIVRLPEECGAQAFGRIAKTWTHANQTIPSHISRRLAPLHRRTQNRHKVKGLTIDTQFHKSDSTQHGAVNFAIVGANVPGVKTLSDSVVSSLGSSGHPGKKRNFVHSRVFSQRRGFGGIIHNVGDAIGDGAGAVGGAISDGLGAVGGTISDGAGAIGGAIGDGAGAIGGAIGDGVGAVGDALTGEKHFNNSISAPLDISKTFTLFDQSIKCTDKFTIPGINGSTISPTISANGQMKVDVEAGIKGTVNIAVAASGSLTDLRVDSFELSTTLNADLNGAIVLSAGVGGSIDSGKIKFFELGIPGFDFPGIFSIGPTFQINGQAKVSLNVDTDMRIGVVYHIGDLKFDFPDGGLKGGTFNPGDTPLQLSAQPSAKATGKVEAHLIPSLNVGINAFGGVTKAEVFANLDASASMTLTEDVTLPSIKANVTLREEKPTVEVVRPVIRGRGAIGAYYLKKRSSGLEDIVEAIEKASEAIVDGVKELKDVLEHPSALSPGIPTATKGSPTGSPSSPSSAIPTTVQSSQVDSSNSPPPVVPTATRSSPGDSTNSSPAAPIAVESSPAVSPNFSSPVIPTATESSPTIPPSTPSSAIDLKDPIGSPNSSSPATPTAAESSLVVIPNSSSSMTIETAGNQAPVSTKSPLLVVPTASESSPTVSSAAISSSTENSPTASLHSTSPVIPTATESLPTVSLNSSSAITTASASSPTVSPDLSSSVTIGTAAESPSSVHPTSSSSLPVSSIPATTAISTSASPKPSDSVVVNDQTKFGGCLEVDAGLVATVGADADFFGLFNPSKTIPLFQKQVSLFKKCYGDTKKRRSMPDLASRHAALIPRDLQCNGGNGSASGLEQLANEIVSALSIL